MQRSHIGVENTLTPPGSQHGDDKSAKASRRIYAVYRDCSRSTRQCNHRNHRGEQPTFPRPARIGDFRRHFHRTHELRERSTRRRSDVPWCRRDGRPCSFWRTHWGRPIILGSILLLLAVGFSGSVGTVFGLLPPAVLGVILFLTGSQLAFVAGMIRAHINQRGRLLL